jgi:hypothetical protein
MTPFQRQCYEAHKAEQARQKEERMPDSPGGGNTPTPNSHPNAGGSGGIQKDSDTIRYESESSGNEANTSFVD